MTVSLAGEVILTSGGWFDEETLQALNIVLRPLQMKVRRTKRPMQAHAHAHAHTHIDICDILLINVRITPRSTSKQTGGVLWRH